MSEPIHVSVEQLYQIAFDTLISFGFNEEESRHGAEVLFASDVRGVDSHGVARLEFYDTMISKGMINKNAKLQVIAETAAAAYLDAQNGLGIVMAPQAMDKCIEKAKQAGIGMVSVKNGGHFGIAGYYAQKAAEQGMIGITFANSAPVMTAFGGRGTVLGNSPVSISFPKGADGKDNVMLDMACSEVAYGKIQIADRKGEKLPQGWAVDEFGLHTVDPQDVLSRPGSLLPFGGPKGYCLAVLLEMMAAVLPGANTGVDVGWIKTDGMKENLGYMFIAIDVNQIRPLKEVEKDIEYYTTKLKNTEPAKGKSEVFLPGEIEHMNMKKRMQEGFNLNYNVAKDLLMLAKKYNRLDKDATIEDLFYIKKEV